jgi:hypothetical protein
MNKLWITALALLLLGQSEMGGGTRAAEEAPTRVRGTLEAVKGNTLTVQTRTGETMDFRLKADAGVFKATPASLDDIKAGDFVGLTSIESEGQRVALEAHLFSEDLRGVGEGHYAWDLVQEPNMMTNATIAEVKQVGDDRALEVEYGANPDEGTPAGTQTILLPPDIPIVKLEKAAGRTLLEPGKEVFLMVEAPEEGALEAVAAVVGDEGAKPPM